MFTFPSFLLPLAATVSGPGSGRQRPVCCALSFFSRQVMSSSIKGEKYQVSVGWTNTAFCNLLGHKVQKILHSSGFAYALNTPTWWWSIKSLFNTMPENVNKTWGHSMMSCGDSYCSSIFFLNAELQKEEDWKHIWSTAQWLMVINRLTL